MKHHRAPLKKQQGSQDCKRELNPLPQSQWSLKKPTELNGSWANTSQEQFRPGMVINGDLQLNLSVIKGTGRSVI